MYSSAARPVTTKLIWAGLSAAAVGVVAWRRTSIPHPVIAEIAKWHRAAAPSWRREVLQSRLDLVSSTIVRIRGDITSSQTLPPWHSLTEVRRAARRRGGAASFNRRRMSSRPFVVVDVTPVMFDRAGDLALATLRTFAALHLASALSIDRRFLDFITYDARLADAARRHGLAAAVPR
jgi:hypothetical protein